jgi:tetratricopeptide (TPR) repeat protein
VNLGRAYYGGKKFAEAATIFEKIAKAEPGSAEVHNNLGNVYFQAKRLPDAAAAYKAALSIRPDYASAHFGLALTYATLGDRKGYIEEYNAVFKLDQNLAAELRRRVPDR